MRRFSAIFLLVGMLQVTPAPAPGDWVLSLFESYLDALRRQAGIPGLVAVIAGEQNILWERGFGQPDLDQAAPVAPDTPFHTDGLMQVVTATLTLQCADAGRLSLDDRVGPVNPLNPDATPTIRQILTHTFGAAENPAYLYQPERYEGLRPVIEACTGLPFHEAVSELINAVGMNDTVPGPDAIFLPPPAPDPLDPEAELRHAAMIARYVLVLDRLATPYAVDPRGSATRSQYLAATLTASNGLVSTARDMAHFHLALRSGALIEAETLAAAWQPPVAASQQALPHASGWFSQNYRGHTVVWQFGVSDGASSSLILSVPARGLTLVMLANSDGLVRPFPLSNGDITVSPFGRVFLGLFVP